MAEVSIQELYDRLYMESASRARSKGQKLPDEIEIFKVLHGFIKDAIARGEESTDALHELSEVQSFHIREQEAYNREQERDKALREGTVLDLDDLLK